LDPEEINKIVESAADIQVSKFNFFHGLFWIFFINKLFSIDKWKVEELDSAGMKRLVASFEKAFTKNQKMRTKFPDEPEK
jgi:hypothetical protein